MSDFKIVIPFSRSAWTHSVLTRCDIDPCTGEKTTCKFCALGFINDYFGWPQTYAMLDKVFGERWTERVYQTNDTASFVYGKRSFDKAVEDLCPIFAEKNLAISVVP